jgi:nitroreductase
MDLATIDHLLTTTRSVRKRLDFDRAVEPELIERCIELALQAPTGSNLQGWHFMVVTDPEQRAEIAKLYRKGQQAYYRLMQDNPARFSQTDSRLLRRNKLVESSAYLSSNLQRVPVLIIPCIERDMAEVPHWAAVAEQRSVHQASLYGSIIPAAWSLMLALRSRGLGSSFTTFHLFYEKEAAELLGIPEHVLQTSLLPVAYYKGKDFRPANRRPGHEVTHWNSWDQSR